MALRKNQQKGATKATAPTGVEEQNNSLDPQRWLQEHGDILFSVAVRQLRDEGLAEELVQDTLVSAYGNAKGYEGRSSERTWLLAVLKHKIIDHIRKESRRRKSAADMEDDAFLEKRFDAEGHFSPGIKPWEEDPEHALEQKDFQSAVAACIDKLPERLGKVFSLREIDGQSADEVCKALDISTTNLWVMLHRARVRLQDCLNSSWFDVDGRADELAKGER